jgi:hypothetical protein
LNEAAQSTSQSVSAISSSETWNWIKPRLSASGYIATPTEINGKFSSDKNQTGSAKLNAASALGVQAQLSDFNRIAPNWGVYTNFAYEQERSIGSASLSNDNGVSSIAANASLNTFILGGGIIFSLNDKIYFPVGINRPVLTNTGKGKLTSFDLNPEMGYQMGVAAKMNKNFAAELVWRKLNFSGSAANETGKSSLSELKMEGLNLQGRYYF